MLEVRYSLTIFRARYSRAFFFFGYEDEKEEIVAARNKLFNPSAPL